MTGLLKAEWRKLRTTRAAWGLLAGAAALTAVSVAAVILTTKFASTGPRTAATARTLDSVSGVRSVISAASAGEVIVLVLGILAITGEYRHGTITQALLTTPVRAKLVQAKLISYAIFGMFFGLVDCLVTVAVAVPWLSSMHLRTPILSHDSLVILGTVLISSALYGLLGVGVGALVRNQSLAIVISLAWLFIVESILIALVPSIGKWTPGGASSALHRSAASAHFLPPWGGGFLLAIYALGFAAIGTRLVLSRDVT